MFSPAREGGGGYGRGGVTARGRPWEMQRGGGSRASDTAARGVAGTPRYSAASGGKQRVGADVCKRRCSAAGR
jgi:hypothetical protein